MDPVDRITLLVNYLTSPKAKKVPSIETAVLSEVEIEDTENLPFAEIILDDYFQEQEQIQPPSQASSQEEPLNVVSASNELVKLLAQYPDEYFSFEADAYSIEDLRELTDEGKIEEWRLLRAGMIATVYGRSVSPDIRKTFRNKFMSLTRHDEIPVNRKPSTYENKVAHEEVLWGFDHLYDLFSNFSHFHIATQKPSKESLSMLEVFIKHVNGTKNYTMHSPTQAYHNGTQGTNENFPGPGIILNGLGRRAKLFPKGFIEETYPQITEPKLKPKQKVENKYRETLVSSERDLINTEFGLFRGFVIISNPKKMLIDEKPYALLIYNDHFHNETQEIAFLIPNWLATMFLDDPIRHLDKESILYPNELMQFYGKEIIVPTYETALGGFDKTFPFGEDAPLFYEDSLHYDMWGQMYKWDLCYPERRLNGSETNDTKGYIHRTHDFAGAKSPDGIDHLPYWREGYDPRNYIPDKIAHNDVRNCLFFAQSQLDLLKAGFRLYNFGYEYNLKFNKWTRDEFRLLKNGIALRESNRFPEGQKPFLVGAEQGRNSHLTEDLLRKVGMVDTNLMLWKKSSEKNPSGIDTKMLPGELPEKYYDLRNKKTWGYFAGKSETENWLEFQNTAYVRKAEPVFYHGQKALIEQILEVIKKKS